MQKGDHFLISSENISSRTQTSFGIGQAV